MFPLLLTLAESARPRTPFSDVTLSPHILFYWSRLRSAKPLGLLLNMADLSKAVVLSIIELFASTVASTVLCKSAMSLYVVTLRLHIWTNIYTAISFNLLPSYRKLWMILSNLLIFLFTFIVRFAFWFPFRPSVY